MTTSRVFTVIAAAICALAITLGTTSPAFADPPAKAPADKKADKPADKPAAPAPAPDKAEKKELVPDAEAQRFVAFFDKLVAIVVATQEDCVKMAAGINGHIDANQALLKEMNDSKNKNRELSPAIKEKIQKKVRDELTPAITKKCSTDKGVEAAFNRMGAGRK
jgi:hypothetical protein